MTSKPEVSVVMGVYNGAGHLRETLDSVLGQEGVDLEFVIVNDGSTDGTAAILGEYAAVDPRVRVFEQENQGLTKALIRGCAEAQGEFIARQDVGDVSLPGRLAEQVRRLKNDDGLVAVSCNTRFVGPAGEELLLSEVEEDDLDSSLQELDPARLKGPSHHGSVTMRAAAYRVAGGYREQFYVAQDLDLWTRLRELGRLGVAPEILYVARLDPGSISGKFAAEQRVITELIALAARARRSRKSEERYLREAAAIRGAGRRNGRARIARGNYFIGSCLRHRAPETAKGYFRAALRNDPLHWKAWIRFAECALRGGGSS